MPVLTKLIRDIDICISVWQSPAGRNVSAELPTPITPKQIETWLQGSDPPKPEGVPETWVHQYSRLERIYTNGKQVIGDNEIGDTSGYAAGGVRAEPRYRAVIVEPGDVPVIVDIPARDTTKGQGETISTTKDGESIVPNKDGKIPTYRIVDNVATKVSER